MAGHVARMEDVRSVFKMLIGKPTGKVLLARPSKMKGEYSISS